ncbi:histone-fold-containing protein [Eremomyces bilateralis CBS 781.70]|uniref:Histone-fold-containing protein n=1 Tax=Eremomyces bilateralis CBS 781.70 TaxID=1392243 RepID=A0A6G1GDD6_9PEZI|nr:histone-fold-containing protein [Eremomyces bilateralis CBS 781.70]KAF1816058.1 histone-fold-containing protein [Eremomyces bilateralis CBS 781.70]
MASPPPLNPFPKKRSSLAPPGPPNKRRKASTGPSLLRQTSFPPDSHPQQFSRSPSVDSSVIAGTPGAGTPSIVSAGGGGKKKRKRKGKGGEVDGDARSLTGSAAKGVGAATGTPSVVEGEGEEEEEEGDGGDVEGGKMDEAEVAQERERLRVLVEAFDGGQTERYAVWRAVKLKKEVVRKLTNQTLSQSVPPSVITTVNGYTKAFVGELVERARQVQVEWMAASAALPTGEEVPSDGPLADRMKERDRGPILPDHLREALRRYKKDQEGGGAGFLGASLDGVQATAARSRGRKLFGGLIS